MDFEKTGHNLHHIDFEKMGMSALLNSSLSIFILGAAESFATVVQFCVGR